MPDSQDELTGGAPTLQEESRAACGRYIWGAALSRRLTSIDVASFISDLRDQGQAVPSRGR